MQKPPVDQHFYKAHTQRGHRRSAMVLVASWAGSADAQVRRLHHLLIAFPKSLQITYYEFSRAVFLQWARLARGIVLGNYNNSYPSQAGTIYSTPGTSNAHSLAAAPIPALAEQLQGNSPVNPRTQLFCP